MSLYPDRVTEILTQLVDLGLITPEQAEAQYAKVVEDYLAYVERRDAFYAAWKDPRPWWQRLARSGVWARLDAWEAHVNRSDA